MGGNFREKLEDVLRIKFRGFKFRGAILYFCSHKRNVNFELGACDANFGFDEERVARLSPERVWLRRLEERWSALASRVLRGRLPRLQTTNSVGARIPEREVLARPIFWSCFSVPCSLLCSLHPSPHAGQLEKGDPTDQGHGQQGTSSEKEL